MLNGDAPADMTGAGHRALKLSAGTRLSMIGMGFIPILLTSAAAAPVLAVLAGWTTWAAALLSPAVVYLLPPVAVRIHLTRRPLPSGAVPLGSPDFLSWWWTSQWQVLYLRLPLLEELLRLVPGLYSFWLRLWGAKVGGLVYWAPGVAVLDRPLLDIGDRVVFGMGVRINPHVLAPVGGADLGLHLGTITIGDDALVGGYSLLLPGCTVAAGAVTPPLRSIHAFTRWGE